MSQTIRNIVIVVVAVVVIGVILFVVEGGAGGMHTVLHSSVSSPVPLHSP